MPRLVQPEWLDELPSGHEGAIGSRRDLQRLNFLMGHPGIIARLLTTISPAGGIKTLVELGAGDGTFLLRVVGGLPLAWRPEKLLLVDRRPSVSQDTQAQFKKCGWEWEMIAADVQDWLSQTRLPIEGTAMMANLFLHHFPGEELATLLSEIAFKSERFAACEPRRSRLGLNASRLVRFIGCNSVTRHDAVVSVQAGFMGHELTQLWPQCSKWNISEGRSGLFSHFFAAFREAGSSS